MKNQIKHLLPAQSAEMKQPAILSRILPAAAILNDAISTYFFSIMLFSPVAVLLVSNSLSATRFLPRT